MFWWLLLLGWWATGKWRWLRTISTSFMLSFEGPVIVSCNRDSHKQLMFLCVLGSLFSPLGCIDSLKETLYILEASLNKPSQSWVVRKVSWQVEALSPPSSSSCSYIKRYMSSCLFRSSVGKSVPCFLYSINSFECMVSLAMWCNQLRNQNSQLSRHGQCGHSCVVSVLWL